MKLFLRRLLAVLSVLAASLAVTGVNLVLCGFRPFVIDSRSMEPLYRKGSLCWVDTRAPLSSLVRGDVLAYRSPADTLVLHRLVNMDEMAGGEEVIVRMQGDANNTVQEMTLSRVNYVGREAFTIPELGTIVSGLSSVKGVILLLAAVLILLACIPRLPRFRIFPRKTQNKEAAP